MAGISDTTKEHLRKHRQEHFEVKVALMDDQFLFDDEISVDITFNGHQWHGFSVTVDEAMTLVQKLVDELSFIEKKDLTLKK